MPCINRHRCETCPTPCRVESQNIELDKWYSSLSIPQKEAVLGFPYPESTTVWNNMRRAEKVVAIRKSGIHRLVGNKGCALGHDF